MFLDDQSEQNFHSLLEALRDGNVTAFIGAGLSASHQPAWEKLHARLQDAAERDTRRAFCAEHAPADFEYFREVLGSDRFFNLLTQQFAGPVADYPDLYQVIDETEGFRHLVTTNFDEFLATVAQKNNRNPEIIAYPRFQPWSARYIYLHGRAYVADRASHLIICEDDYSRAYGEEFGPRSVIQVLLTGTVVFIGYSLRDGDMQATLRALKAFRTRRAEAVSGDLFIFRSAEPNTPAEEIAVSSDRLHRRWGLHPIWYLREPGHPQLEMLLRQLQHDTGARPREMLFIERALDLQELGALTSPSDEQVARVVEALRVPEAARYFFRTTTSPAWCDPLLEAQLLEAVGDPRQVPSGGFQASVWAAAPYVIRIAHQRPDVVTELMKRLRHTRNWNVIYTLSDLAKALPDEYLTEVLPVMTSWLKTPRPRYDLVSHYLVEAVEVLSERGSTRLAGDILEHLVELRDQEATGAQEIDLWAERHGFDRLLMTLPTLISDQPQRMYTLFADRLREAQARLPSWQRSGYWRTAIGEHDSDAYGSEETVNFLITGMRDSLIGLVQADASEGSRVIEELIQTGDELSYRLALHTLTEQPELLDHLSVGSFDEIRLRDESSYELLLFIHRRFAELRDQDREVIHRVIATGPPIESAELSADDRQRIVDRWHWRWIGALPEALRTADEQARWKEVRRVFGDFEPYLAPPSRAKAVWDHTPESTAIVEELQQAYAAGPDELLAAWRRGAYWGPLGSLVQADPAGLLDLASRFESADFEHLTGYFHAYQNLIRGSDQVFPWTPLISLMDQVAYQDDRELLLSMMWLLREGLTAKASPIPDDLVLPAFQLATTVLTRAATPLGAGWRSENGFRFHQLNSPAGQAADSLMICIWRMAKQDLPERCGLPEHVGPCLDHAIEAGWGGVELRFAIGEHWRTLDWCQPGWLASVLNGLAPEQPTAEGFDASYAFLHGYLTNAQYTSASMLAVIPLWQRVMPDIGREDPQYLNEQMSAERFTDHVVLGWVFDVEGYGELLDALVERAPDRLRAHLIEWAANQVNRYPDEETRQRWLTKIDEYWSRRVGDLRPLPVSTPSEELAAFIFWAREIGASLADTEDRLNLSIDHLPANYGVYRVFEYLAECGADESAAAARVLRRIVERWAGKPQAFMVPRSKVMAVIEAICSGDEEYESDLLAAVDRLIEVGWTDLMDHLDEWGLGDQLRS